MTEYRRRTPSHTAPFTIEVEYSNETDTQELLHELLYSYQEFWSPDVERLAQSEKTEETKEYNTIENRSGAALATLRSIFPEADEINTEYLKDRSDGAFDKILQRLKHLAQELQWPEGAQDGTWIATATDAGACREQVDLFMKNGLWPLTNVVRSVYMNEDNRKPKHC